MTPRRVLLRIKKLRRFLDERIGDAARRREAADDAESRAEAAGRLDALQEVRGEMVGERLAEEDIELEPDVDAAREAEAAPPGDADGEPAEDAPGAAGEAGEAGEARAGG